MRRFYFLLILCFIIATDIAYADNFLRPPSTSKYNPQRLSQTKEELSQSEPDRPQGAKLASNPLVFETKEIAEWQAARSIADLIMSENKEGTRKIVIGFATGGTYESIYKKLIWITKKLNISWENVVTFNLDEYVWQAYGYPEEYCKQFYERESYGSFMYKNLFQWLIDNAGLKEENIHLMDGLTNVPELETRLYEEAIMRETNGQGVDLQLLGIGEDGHIAFIEPRPGMAMDDFLSIKTRIEKLSPSTIRANSRFFDGKEEAVPHYAMTQGMFTILKAKNILLVATGPKKAEAIKNAVKGERNSSIPASVLQLHSGAIFMVDRDAAGGLKSATAKALLREILGEKPEATLYLEDNQGVPLEGVPLEGKDPQKYQAMRQYSGKYPPDYVNDFIAYLKRFVGLEEEQEKLLDRMLNEILKVQVKGKNLYYFLSDEDIFALFFNASDRLIGGVKAGFSESMKKLNDESIKRLQGITLGDYEENLIYAASADKHLKKDEDFKRYSLSKDIDDSKRLVKAIEDIVSNGGHLTFFTGVNGGIVFDLKIFGEGLIKKHLKNNGIATPADFSITFVVKKDRILDDVCKKDLDYLLNNSEFQMLKGYKKRGFFKIVTVDVDSQGFNLLGLRNDKLGEQWNRSKLVLAKGGNNALTMRLLNKDYFVLGLLMEGDVRLRHYTGLKKEKEPQIFIAYIPKSMETTTTMNRSEPMGQQLWQFVQAMQSEEFEKLIQNSTPKSEEATLEKLKQDMEKLQTPFVALVKPELLGQTPQSKAAFKKIGGILRRKEALTLEGAIKNYANAKGLSEYLGASTIFELNQAINAKESIVRVTNCRRMVKEIGEKANELGDQKSVVVTEVVMSENEFNFDVELAASRGKDLISPEEIIDEKKYKERQGIVFNFLYFITRNLIAASNRIRTQAKLGDKLGGQYVDFLKKDEVQFPPLFNKAAVAVNQDGSMVFGRIKLTKGSITIGNEKIEFRSFDKTGNEDAIAYTSWYENEFVKSLPDKKKLYDESKKAGYKSSFNLKIPEKEVKDRFQIVLVNDTILYAIKGATEIPSFGWVVSVSEDGFEKLKEKDLFIKSKDKDNIWEPTKKKARLNFDLDDEFKNAKTIMGGATLLVGDGNREKFYNAINKNEEKEAYDGITQMLGEVMAEEGWNLMSSCQTQETDVSKLVDRQPRQIIGEAENTKGKEFFFVYSFSGRASYSCGATYTEALYIIAEELKSQGKKLKYALLLDDGGSVSTGMFDNGKYYGLNIVAPGPINYIGEVRTVNSIGIMVRSRQGLIEKTPKADSLIETGGTARTQL